MSNHNHVAGVPGADPTLPDVALVLNGKTHHLAFDFNAIVLAEKATGINLLRSIVNEISATNLRALLWAALLKENPKLTVEEVGTWITMRNAATIHNALITAWFGSIEEPKETEAAPGEDEAQETTNE